MRLAAAGHGDLASLELTEATMWVSILWRVNRGDRKGDVQALAVLKVLARSGPSDGSGYEGSENDKDGLELHGVA